MAGGAVVVNNGDKAEWVHLLDPNRKYHNNWR